MAAIYIKIDMLMQYKGAKRASDRLPASGVVLADEMAETAKQALSASLIIIIKYQIKNQNFVVTLCP